VLSFEEPVGFDAETGEESTLGEMLGANYDDPSRAAARNLDWSEFLAGRDWRYGAMALAAAAGSPLRVLKKQFRVSDSTLSKLRRRLAADIRESMGEAVLAEVCRPPRWKGDLAVENEKAACRAERRHGAVH